MPKSNVLVTQHEHNGVITIRAMGNKRLDEYTLPAGIMEEVVNMVRDSAAHIVNLGECAHYWASKGLQSDIDSRKP